MRPVPTGRHRSALLFAALALFSCVPLAAAPPGPLMRPAHPQPDALTAATTDPARERFERARAAWNAQPDAVRARVLWREFAGLPDALARLAHADDVLGTLSGGEADAKRAASRSARRARVEAALEEAPFAVGLLAAAMRLASDAGDETRAADAERRLAAIVMWMRADGDGTQMRPWPVSGVSDAQAYVALGGEVVDGAHWLPLGDRIALVVHAHEARAGAVAVRTERYFDVLRVNDLVMPRVSLPVNARARFEAMLHAMADAQGRIGASSVLAWSILNGDDDRAAARAAERLAVEHGLEGDLAARAALAGWRLLYADAAAAAAVPESSSALLDGPLAKRRAGRPDERPDELHGQRPGEQLDELLDLAEAGVPTATLALATALERGAVPGIAADGASALLAAQARGGSALLNAAALRARDPRGSDVGTARVDDALFARAFAVGVLSAAGERAWAHLEHGTWDAAVEPALAAAVVRRDGGAEAAAALHALRTGDAVRARALSLAAADDALDYARVDAVAYLMARDAHGDANHAGTALAMIDRLFAVTAPTLPPLAWLDTRAVALAALGRRDEALAVYAQVASRTPSEAGAASAYPAHAALGMNRVQRHAARVRAGEAITAATDREDDDAFEHRQHAR